MTTAQGLVEPRGTTALGKPGHVVELTTSHETSVEAFLKELSAQHGLAPQQVWLDPRLLGLLTERDVAVVTQTGFAFDRRYFQRVTEVIVGRLALHGRIRLSEIRDACQTTRQYAQALAEHLDAVGVTQREGEFRYLVSRPNAVLSDEADC